eukprot:304812-Lingulodinium_polyedra.AAC.1
MSEACHILVPQPNRSARALEEQVGNEAWDRAQAAVAPAFAGPPAYIAVAPAMAAAREVAFYFGFKCYQWV